MTKRQAGSMGGKATFAKHGREHMRQLADRWHDKYRLVPVSGNDFLIVNRGTGAVNARTLNGARYDVRQKD